MSINNNQIINIYRRLLYKKKIATINILSTTSNSLYDDVLYNLTDPHMTFLPSSFNNSIISSSIIFINDPGLFVSQEGEISKFTNKVLFFHNDKILKMKKEDLHLFNNEINKYDCYTFDEKISTTNSNIIPIQYGFKPPTKTNNTKSKSIILLGNEQNIDVIMYNQIKQAYGDVDLINWQELSGKDLSGILNQYRICITMNYKYNSLLAASNGCFVISNIEDKTVPYGVHANDFGTIMNSIDNLLSKNTSLHEEISNNIVTQYDYSKFTTAISKIVQNTCNRIIKL